jgi:hypothetical protein
MVYPVAYNYFTQRIHTTNVVTQFAIITQLHIMHVTPDKMHIVKKALPLL